MAGDDSDDRKGEESTGTLLETALLAPLANFVKDSIDLINRAHKPDRKEYFGVLNATAWGLIIMGGLGYIIKLVHYPVKEILVGVKSQ